MNNKNDDRYVKKLKEEVYYSRNADGDLDTSIELKMFFDELVARKRYDPIDGGLQAAMIVLSDRFAAKVNEEDGTGLHSCEFVNLVKYLNSDYKYFSQKAMRFPVLYSEQTDIISREGLEIRILDGEDTLMIAIYSFSEINDYQRDIIKRLLFICNSNLDNYQNIEIGVSTPNVVVDFTDLDKGNYEYINSIIDSKHSRIKR